MWRTASRIDHHLEGHVEQRNRGRVEVCDRSVDKSPSEFRVMDDICALLRFSYDNWENDTGNSGLSKIWDEIFRVMPVLKVLDLSFTSIKEIPASIGQLVQMQHLDLSGFSQLVVLNLYKSYGSWESRDGENKDDDIQFVDLEGLRDHDTLDITIDNLGTLMKLSRFGNLLNCIQYLYIKECEGLHLLQLPATEISGDWLRRLSINNCYDLKYMEIGDGMTETWLNRLEVLVLHGLPNMITVRRNPVTDRSLRSLRSLNIW
ncbi:hypothetical protein CRG98_025967 [Punica granatum]|uniref:Uncharacterized protein n=1 Tax=Punica granatum TaxID=22663 RepID=A0A2I0JBM9_PUNGR|nr:hypothetical protein CRG98_025967 [Punica granatum]